MLTRQLSFFHPPPLRAHPIRAKKTELSLKRNVLAAFENGWADEL